MEPFGGLCEKPLFYSSQTLPSRKSEAVRGIYGIWDTIACRAYIGSSIHIYRRLRQHLADLKCGCHHNRELRFAWNKRGAGNYLFAVIELVDPGFDLTAAEQAWRDRIATVSRPFNAGLDVSRPFKGLRHGTRTRVAMKKANRSGRPVTIEGQNFPSVRAAAKSFRVTRSTVYMALANGGKFVGRHTGRKQVVINGVEYPSLRAAASAHGMTDSGIAYRFRSASVSYTTGLNF